MIGFKPQFPDLEPVIRQRLIRRIVETTDPLKIVLFGSRARGDHRNDSDVDLLIIQESIHPRHERARSIYAAIADIRVPVDVEAVVYTPDEVEDWRNVPAALVTTAMREGQVLYVKE